MKRKIYAAFCMLLMMIYTFPAFASSHREAPLLLADPQADNTDLYAFRSPDDPNKVTIIANYYSLHSYHRADLIIIHLVRISGTRYILITTLQIIHISMVMILFTVSLLKKPMKIPQLFSTSGWQSKTLKPHTCLRKAWMVE